MTGPRNSRKPRAHEKHEMDRLSRVSRFRVFRGVPLLILLAVSACGQRQSAGGLTIAVIPKGTSHVFWQSIHAGAEKAARETGSTIIWRGPLREDDRDSQVSEVEGFVSRGVSGIVLAPLDEAALAPPVADAARRGIPVVVIDSGLKGSGYVSFVATDNRKGGRLAGDHLAGLLKDAGRIVMLRYAEGSESSARGTSCTSIPLRCNNSDR